MTVNSSPQPRLSELLAKRRGAEVTQPFEYRQFRNTSITDIPTRFTRYLFSWVYRFIARETKSGEKHPFGELVTGTGAVNGFHIEHNARYALPPVTPRPGRPISRRSCAASWRCRDRR